MQGFCYLWSTGAATAHPWLPVGYLLDAVARIEQLAQRVYAFDLVPVRLDVVGLIDGDRVPGDAGRDVRRNRLLGVGSRERAPEYLWSLTSTAAGSWESAGRSARHRPPFLARSENRALRLA